jgi:phosphoribosylglycinamide formyltransferase 1
MTLPAGPLRLAVLISGRGSNLIAIAAACAEGRIPAIVAAVASDKADAPGLAHAARLGLPTVAVPATAYRHAGMLDRAAFESALAAAVDAARPDLVVLAGFMRVLSPDFVARYAGRLLNIHPSLLPRHKGLHTHERVLEAGDAEHGASVHYVTAELDGGPVVLQAVVPVLPGDTPDRLQARVQVREHMIYPRVIDWIARGRLTWNGGQPRLDGRPLLEPLREVFAT